MLKSPVDVNVVLALLLEASVADTVCEPGFALGIVISTPEKPPVAPEVTDAGSVVTVVPFTFIVMALVPAKPVPVITMPVPSGPVVGSMVMDGVVLKFADPLLLEASVPTTAWVPCTEAGTANVTPAGMFPLPSVVTVPGDVVSDAPPKVKVTTEVAANPLPEIPMVAPTIPDAGVIAIEAVTVKVAVADPE